jgi:hypothetical protein
VTEEKTFDIAGYVFPIVSATQGEKILSIDRFIGSGFWIDSKGHFLTCKHVFDELKDGQVPAIAHPFGDKRDRYTPIIQNTHHKHFDMALGTAAVKKPTPFLLPYEGTFSAGLDVSAFGFTDWGKANRSLQIDVRYLKGHIVRTSEESLGLPSAQVVEISFGSPSGFSGTPLLCDFKFTGMLYSNIESKLQSYSVNEVVDGDKEFREIAYRIYEYGVAHHPADLIQFINECGVTPFE